MRATNVLLIFLALAASCADNVASAPPASDAGARCVLPSDCGRGFYCSPTGACTNDCREDRDCVGSTAGPVCAMAEGRCVAADAGPAADAKLPADVASEAMAPDVPVDLPPPPDVAADVAAEPPAQDAPAPIDAIAPDLPMTGEDATVDVASDLDPVDLPPAPDAAPPDLPRPDAAPDAPACVSPPLPVTGGLWARYPFDGDATDVSGSRRDGTVTGAVRFAPSPNCQAAEFSAGAAALVDLPDAHFAAVTVATWARPDAGGSLFDGWTRSENVLLSVATVGGVLHWEGRFHDRPDTSRQYNEIFVRAPARAGAWQHVAATYDGTTLRLYVDGVLRGSAATDRGLAYPAPSGDPDLRVGADRTGAGWSGAVDDLAVYERALSDREVGLLAGCADGACRRDVVLQPGPGVAKDIWTTSVYSFAPGGSGPGGGRDDDTLKVGGWGDTYLSLLQFDLNGLPPSPVSATLELYCYANNGATNTAVWVDRVSAPWDWRTGGTGRDRERLWWADRPPTTPWRMVDAPSVGAWHRIDVLALVSDWLGGRAPNHGLQLRPVGTSNNFNFYYSGEVTADPTLRPRLLIRY